MTTAENLMEGDDVISMSSVDTGELRGPDGVPILGNTLQFARDPFGFYEECAEFGDVVPYSVGRQQFYMVLHPDDVKRVLSTEHDSFRKGQFQREQLGFVLGDGLLTSEGDRWREQRQRIQPSFSPDKIQSYVATMTDCAADAVERWDAGETVEIDEEMRRVTVRILARSLFGTDITEHVETISEAMADIGALSEATTMVALLPTWVPTPWNRRAKRGVEAIDGVIDALVAEREGDAEGRDDLLSTLIVAHRNGEIPRETLRDQLVTFLLAGHETTSLALTYTWYLLARNPDVRERLHAELNAELGGSRPEMIDLPDLSYTDRVVTESMRLYPPVYRVVREATEPVELGGHTIESGAKLTIPQWNVHRDERWYDDPEQFRPDRWTDDGDRPEYAYFPFGGGPRRCIGMRFARMEAKLVLGTIAQSYELHLADSERTLTLQPGVTAGTADPVEMVPRER